MAYERIPINLGYDFIPPKKLTNRKRASFVRGDHVVVFVSSLPAKGQARLDIWHIVQQVANTHLKEWK